MELKLFIISLLFIIVDISCNTINDGPIVEVQQGSVQGIIQYSQAGKEYYAFLGIPYGKSPIGNLRYKVQTPY